MDSDPFSNFSFKPPRTQGPFRAFTRNRSKYKYMSGNSSRDKLMRTESSSSIASMTGSTQNLLDPKVMSMQDDARSRKITTEVMKNRLYESVVISPRKRRFSMRMDYGSNSGTPDMQTYARMVQSLPVTPAHSQNVTPNHSPTASRRFLFGYFSRGTTPHCVTPEEEDEMECEDVSSKGLATLLKPAARFIPATRISDDCEQSMDCDLDSVVGGLMGPPETPGFMLMNVPKPKRGK